MGDLVAMKKETVWKIAIGVGLLLTPVFTGSLMGADVADSSAEADQQAVASETVRRGSTSPRPKPMSAAPTIRTPCRVRTVSRPVS